MKLGKIIFISVIVLIYFGIDHMVGQTGKQNYLGMHFSFGTCDYSRGGAVVGALTFKNYEGNNFKSLGFDYARRTSKNLDLCLGVVIMSNSLTVSTSGLNSSGSNSDELFFMFSLPVHLKYHFLKYLFVDGGLCANIHPSLGYKWGAGVGLSAGVEYVFTTGISVSLYPFIQWNALNIGGSQGESIGGIDQLSQKGIRIGAGYRF